jgi:hypothetical protein
VSVPEAAGREALRRLLAYAQPAVAPGPVAVTATGRVLFYVAPGGREDLPELLDWLDWGGVQLDLTAFSADSAGSTADGSPLDHRPAEWLNPADAEPPELIALLATIASACHRLAVMRGARTGRDIKRPE